MLPQRGLYIIPFADEFSFFLRRYSRTHKTLAASSAVFLQLWAGFGRLLLQDRGEAVFAPRSGRKDLAQAAAVLPYGLYRAERKVHASTGDWHDLRKNGVDVSRPRAARRV